MSEPKLKPCKNCGQPVYQECDKPTNCPKMRLTLIQKTL